MTVYAPGLAVLYGGVYVRHSDWKLRYSLWENLGVSKTTNSTDFVAFQQLDVP